MKAIAHGSERRHGTKLRKNITPSVVRPAGDDVVLRIDIAPHRALDVGERIVDVAADLHCKEIVDALAASPLLSAPAAPAKSILCGVLAGSDLRLAEVGEIAEGVRDAFGRRAAFDLATVNDDESFSGRISAVAMLFEGERSADAASAGAAGRRGRKDRNPLAPGPQGRGRFNNVEPTVWNGEDLDVPAYARRNISLDI